MNPAPPLRPFVDFALCVVVPDPSRPDDLAFRGFWRDAFGVRRAFGPGLTATIARFGPGARAVFFPGSPPHASALAEGTEADDAFTGVLDAVIPQPNHADAAREYGGWLLHSVLLANHDVAAAFAAAWQSYTATRQHRPGLLFRVLLQFDESARGWSRLRYELAYQGGAVPNHLHRDLARPVLVCRVLDIEKYDDDSPSEYCRGTEFFCGIASPWDHLLPALDFDEAVRDAIPAAHFDRFLSRPTLVTAGPSRRHDVVILIAHGETTTEGPRLWALQGNHLGHNPQARMGVAVRPDEVANFCECARARLAVLVCCQPSGGSNRAFHELGECVLRSAPGLAAVVSFRASVQFDVAFEFLRGLLGAVRDRGALFFVSNGFVAGRQRIPQNHLTAGFAHLPRFDFAVPAVHARRELALELAPGPGFVPLTKIPPVAFPPALRDSFLALVAEWEGTNPAERRGGAERARRDAERWTNTPSYQTANGVAIGRYPVTWGEYGKFPDARRPPAPYPGDWLPVTGLTYDEITKYVAWLNRGGKIVYRLPRLAEWVQIAYWGSPTLFPWGNEWPEVRPRAEGGELRPVYETWSNPRQPPESRVFGMLGNCREVVTVTQKNGINQKEVTTLMYLGGSYATPRWAWTAAGYERAEGIDPSAHLPADAGFRLVRTG